MEAIKIAIEGLNEEKLRLTNALPYLPHGNRGIEARSNTTQRLREIDAQIIKLLSPGEAARKDTTGEQP